MRNPISVTRRLGRLHIRAAGHTVVVQNPFEYHGRKPRNWECRSCGRTMRWDQARDGRCGWCGGLIRKNMEK